MSTSARAQLQKFIALLDAGNTVCKGITVSIVRTQDEAVSEVTSDSDSGILLLPQITMCTK